MPTLTQAEVDYGRAPLLSPKRCGTCVMFRPARITIGQDFAAMFGLGAGACTLVQGDIRGRDVCDRWAGVRLP